MKLPMVSGNAVVLFQEKKRTRTSPMRPGEWVFDFYDASARKPFEFYRKLLNTWIARYPNTERTEIVRRFSKGSDSQYFAALAEVIVHEAIVSGPGKIKHHPTLASSSARPDFLKYSMSDDVEAYVEVTTCAPTDQAIASGNRLASIYNAIEKISPPLGYCFGISVEEHGATSPSLILLKEEIKNWVDNVKDNIMHQGQDSRVFAFSDWKIELQLMRFSSPGKKADSAIGAYFTGARWIDASSDLRSRLEGKSRRYGVLGAPFLLVIADCKGEIGWAESAKRELIEALFGDEAFTVWQDTSGNFGAEPRRNLNGFFGDPDVPKNQNVSAVLLLPQPDLWGLRNPLHQPLLVHNPWSRHPLCRSVLPVPNLQLGPDGHLHENIGVSLADLLALPTNWPPPF